MRHNSVSFPCGSLKLEGACYFPDGNGTFPAVALCHPHSLYGGSMNNNVIHAVAAALISQSMIAFMFNFRGVGRSQGKFGNGITEQEDVAAAISWLVSQPEVDADKMGLVGYSFGASVGSPVACDDKRVKAMALISPPLESSQLSQLKSCPKPKFIVSGSEDFVVSPEQAELINRELAEPKQFELISGADHFWWGHELTIAEKIAAFFSTIFKQPP